MLVVVNGSVRYIEERILRGKGVTTSNMVPGLYTPRPDPLESTTGSTQKRTRKLPGALSATNLPLAENARGVCELDRDRKY